MAKYKQQAVIFDFDGVLANTFNLNLSLIKQFEDASADDLKSYHDGNIHERSKVQFDDETRRIFFKKQLEKFQKEQFFPIQNAVQELAKDYILFVNSSGSENNIEQFLAAIQLAKCFEKIFGLESSKSKVEKFKMIFRDYDFEPENCLFITDTLGDLEEGAEAGVKNIAVSWGYHKRGRLEKGNPLAIVDVIDELVPAVKNVFKI